ncbi:MAG: diacylglycerol kinase family protein [Bacteroidota bacterium]
MRNEWMVIINPHAGSRKAGKDWIIVKEMLMKEKINFVFEFTDSKYHATELTLKFIEEGYRKFIAFGGDGTLNEIVNGIFIQKIIPTKEFTLAMLPVGTGNDWCRMFNIPIDYAGAIKVIKNEKIFIQDVGTVNYYNNGWHKINYFANVTGIGYDALVNRKTNLQKDKGRGGKLSYFLNIFSSLFGYKVVPVTIDADGVIIKANLFSMNVGICKYNGGGMMQLPNAVADDGLLDLTIIKKISKLELFMSLKRLYDGTLLTHPKVEAVQAKNIVITADDSIYLEADGEFLGNGPFTFNIILKSLSIVCA